MLASAGAAMHTGSAGLVFVANLVFAAALGAGFGLLVAQQRTEAGETLFWGLGYGAFWWFLGPLTLLPVLFAQPAAWDLAAARAQLPSLIGHLLYGGVTALLFVALRRRSGGTERFGIAGAARGVAAGLAVATLLYLGFDVMAGASLGWLFAVGTLSGIGFPLLFTARPEGAGPALVRGTAYGFLWWILAPVTVRPLLRGEGLGWSRVAVAGAVEQLPVYLLLGAGIGLVFTVLGSLGRGLFVDDVSTLRAESPGGRGLRATVYGAIAGLLGGLVFTLVMVLVNELPTVATIVGGHTRAVGLVVHLLIAQIIGVSYAVLFRRRSFDMASGIGWGVCYGFFWWVLGNLTLLPILTGTVPVFDAATIGAGFPSLVGHLAYGAALGAVYYKLEDRANPWWFTRNDLEAQRITAQREQTLGSAPALWGLTVVIALTIPLIISG
jgi:uncharacterized membrane protein YagU involved in acid resistance